MATKFSYKKGEKPTQFQISQNDIFVNVVDGVMYAKGRDSKVYKIGQGNPQATDSIDLTKLKGVDGANGLGRFTAFVYSQLSSTPPNDATYDGSTFTPPTGWFNAASDVATSPIYSSSSQWIETSPNVWEMYGVWADTSRWDGIAPVTINITNQSVVIPSDANGVPLEGTGPYANSGCTITAKRGDDVLIHNSNNSTPPMGEFFVYVYARSNITEGSKGSLTDGMQWTDLSNFLNASDNAEIIYEIRYRNGDDSGAYEKIRVSQTFVKGKKGTDGAVGDRGSAIVYISGTSFPANPESYFPNGIVVTNDVLSVSGDVNNAPITKRYNGTTWDVLALFVHGDAMVTGTVFASKLDVTSVQTDIVQTTLLSADKVTTGTLASTDGTSTIIDLDVGTITLANGGLTYDATNGLVIDGNITATSGLIGGWDINTSFLESTSGLVTLDGSNGVITLRGNASNYVVMDATGLRGLSGTLGTTFNLPSDGSAPTFSSGIINKTVYELTTASIIRTSSIANRGVKIDNNGIAGYSGTGVKTFGLDATTGDATLSGKVTGSYGEFTSSVVSSTGVYSTLLSATSADSYAGYFRSTFTGNTTKEVVIIRSDYNDGAEITTGWNPATSGATTSLKIYNYDDNTNAGSLALDILGHVDILGNSLMTGDLTVTGVITNFTGGHRFIMMDAPMVGDIITLSNMTNYSIKDVVGEGSTSTVAYDKTVFGVFNGDIKNELGYVNALGDGMINVCAENGDIEAGDYICSSNTKGKGMKQNDDLLHNYTVAKALEGATFQEGDTHKMIACTYHGG